jgi:ABC-type multidrug transport system fused ATPase/permease subunit
LFSVRRAAIPWRRLLALTLPARRALLGMVALTALGALLGLVPPLAFGALIDDLAGGHHAGAAALAAAPAAALIVAALLLEALCFALSDGFFAQAVGTLYRELRMLMFKGLQTRPPASAPELAGAASRFVSDAQALQDVVVAPLDTAVIGLFELVSALVTLAVLYPPAALYGAALIALTGLIARRSQAPLGPAAERRQEALEAMSHTLAAELSARLERGDAARAGSGHAASAGPDAEGHGAARAAHGAARAAHGAARAAHGAARAAHGAARAAHLAAAGRFHEAVSRVRRREVRLGWLEAANRYGAGAAANLGPIAVVVLAAVAHSFSAGTLLALFLLAERAFQGGDSLIDLGFDLELVRGAVARCFELVDLQAPLRPALTGRPGSPDGGGSGSQQVVHDQVDQLDADERRDDAAEAVYQEVAP